MPDSVAILRPNATIAQGSWTLGGAPASAHVATSDNLDTTYVQDLVSGAGTLKFDMTTFAFGTAKIKSVKPRMRLGTDDALSSKDKFAMVFFGADRSKDHRLVLSQTAAGINTYSGIAQTFNPQGLPWSQADIDALQAHFFRKQSDTNDRFRLYEVYLDVAYNQAPTATVTNPTEAQSFPEGSALPTVSWTYSDPENDQQERFRIKIFKDTVYSAGGFNPETSTAAWDSGEVYSQSTSMQIGAPISNGTFRAYVKVADVGSAGRYGPWDFNSFVMNLDVPQLPSLGTLVETTAQGVRIRLQPTEHPSGIPTTAYFRIERQQLNGAWTTVRGAGTLSNTGTPTVYDYEAPHGVNVSYRAIAVRLSGGSAVESVPSVTQVVAMPAATDWWLKDPIDSTRNMQLLIIGDSFDIVEPEDKAFFSPLSRSRKVSVADVIRGAEGSFNAEFLSEAEYQKFRTLRNSQRTLLLQSALVPGEQWYISLEEDLSYRTYNYAPAYRIVVTKFTEVDVP